MCKATKSPAEVQAPPIWLCARRHSVIAAANCPLALRWYLGTRPCFRKELTCAWPCLPEYQPQQQDTKALSLFPLPDPM